MRAVFSKELKQQLFSYTGIGFMGLLLLFSGVMISIWNLKELSSSFTVIFAYLPFALIVLLPILTIGAFSRERREGTDRFLAMLPLSSKDIVHGKYFSRLVILLIPNVLLAFVPLILDMSGEVAYASSYAVLLVFSLLEAFLLALCLFVDAKCKEKITSMVLPYAVLSGLFLIGYSASFIPKTNTVLTILTKILTNVSPFSQFDGFLYGMFDFRVIFVYLAFTILFIYLCVLGFDKAHGSYGYEDYRKTAVAKGARTVSLILLCAILAANIGVLTAPDRYSKIDITDERTYTLSEETKSYLSALDKEITVYAVNFDYSEQRIRLFLDRMASYSRYLKIVDVDTSKDTAVSEKYGLTEMDESAIKNSIIIESAERAQMLYYSQMFTYTNETLGFSRISASEWQYYYSMYSQSTDYAQYAEAMINDTEMYFEGQTLLLERIEYCAADYIPAPYVLVGHDLDLTQSFFAYMCSYYGMEPKELALSDGDSVPPDVSSLLIPKPTTDITDGELSAIREYLNRGGQVTVITSESNLSMHNLTALLSEYGMSAEEGTLRDIIITEEATEEIEAKKEETAILVTKPNYDHDIMAGMANGNATYTVTVTDANAITLDKNDPELLLTPILTTNDTAYMADAPDKKASYTVAATAEKANGARLVWFTGADSLLGLGDLDNVGEQQISDTMAVLLAMTWTNNVYESTVAEAPASKYTVASLDMNENTATWLGVVFVAIIPICVVSPLIAVRYKREKA
jgi:ABC-2 type transport system permease protein